DCVYRCSIIAMSAGCRRSPIAEHNTEESNAMSAYKPIPPGTRFTRLIVLGPAEPNQNTKYKRKASLCRCDCGTTKAVENGCLRTGNTTSCGCLQHEVISIEERF